MPKDSSGLEPLCLAFVLCEYAHRDGVTGRYTLLSILSSLRSKFFPGDTPTMYVYVALTDGRGMQRVTVRLVDVDDADDEPLVESSTPVTFTTPQGIVEQIFQVHPFQFWKPGDYRLQLLVDDAIITEQTLRIEKDDGDAD